MLRRSASYPNKALLVVAVIAVLIALAIAATQGCLLGEERWVEGLDGQPLRRCY